MIASKRRRVSLSACTRAMLAQWTRSKVSFAEASGRYVINDKNLRAASHAFSIVASLALFIMPLPGQAAIGLEDGGSKPSAAPQLRGSYSPPSESGGALAGVSFTGQPVGTHFVSRFSECDAHDTCNGKALNYKCSTDRNENTVLLRLKNGVVFFDGKLGVDADGSPYAKTHQDNVNQDQTSLRYPLKGDPSVNADRVPFVVIPLGGFGKELGVEPGDVAVVVWKSKRVFAVVGDEGPPCKIGEGSIALHEALGHSVCRHRSSAGDCQELRDASIENNVLYFIFPHTKAQLYPGLTPDNVGARIESIGTKAWTAFIGQ